MKRFFSLVSLAAMLAIGVYAEAQTLSSSALKDPPWLLLELGKRAYHEGNFGQALDYFRTSIARGGTTPEAEMWIGHVFQQEGELDLAEIQYQRALSAGSQFEIPGEATSILYDLARIYYNTDQYGKYEVTLEKIVAADKEFSGRAQSFTREAMVRILTTDGLDKLLVLYRLRDRPALLAHSDLGELSYRTGRYSDAVVNLTFSTIIILTVAIDAFKARDSTYDFTTVANLFAKIAPDRTVSAYIASTHFFRDLYYLGAALYAEGHQEHADAIWRVVTKWSPKDQWYRRSSAQLQHPFVEPIMHIQQ